MMKVSLMVILLMWAVGLMAQTGDWKLERDRDGIKVYLRSTEGSKIKQFRVVSAFDGSLHSFLAVLLDVEAYESWLANCEEARLLQRPAPDEMLYYMETAVPFPFANRDMVQHFHVEIISPNQLIVHLDNRPAYVEEADGLVRMPIADGQWKVSETTPGKLEVDFVYQSDPAGNIPVALVNAFLVDTPYKTVDSIRELVNTEPYASMRIEWLD